MPGGRAPSQPPHRTWHVATGVAKTDGGQHIGKGERFVMVRRGVLDRVDQVGADQSDRLQAIDVAHRVGAL